MDEIKISEKMVERLKSLTQEMERIKLIINTILETIIIENNGEGPYELTKDWRLVLKTNLDSE